MLNTIGTLMNAVLSVYTADIPTTCCTKYKQIKTVVIRNKRSFKISPVFLFPNFDNKIFRRES